ncbi:APC membrane recruitment protein 2 [Pseudochaenichthys georgianus]|uniref:APC membrane recruitment protein 2 n=1 Tax=Pseudochaenichthys georgianus TaxID=52239 RepID=UPI00146DC9C4|nr:APC membrane recruitment protein 2 [Pseudochaenichthys georgianus]
MELQSECVEPPVAPQCDSQPTGKINKAAFKLFGKRRTGSGMASFFSFRNKGATNSGNNGNSDNGNSLNGNESAASVELVRSRTLDGLTSSNNDADGQRGEGLAIIEAGPVRSLSKSLSFFSLLRRGSFRSSENGGTGISRRGRGLKGFFSSMRWRRKDKTNDGEGEVVERKLEKDGDVADSEKVTDITLTLEPPPHHQVDCGDARASPNPETPTSSVTMTPPHCVAMPGPSGEPDSPFAYTPTDSPLHPPIQIAKASISSLTPSLATPPLDCCSTGDPPSEPSVDRLCSLLFTDVTSLKSFDSLTGCGDIIADAEEEGPAGNGGSGTSSSSSGGGSVGPSVGRTVGITSVPSRSSPTKPPLPLQRIQHMFSVSACSVPSSLPARARAPPPPQQHPAGSGVVAYMGGGEEMASPEGVDDADMQGLWHMLPSTGDNSPALPRSHQPSSSTPTSTYPPRAPSSCHLPSAHRSTDRKIPQVKALGLSKIPLGGAAGGRAAKPPLPHTHGRLPTSPGEKEPLSDEGYWDTPSATPTATPDESGLQRNQRIALLRDSCSGDHLYDFYNDPEEEGEDEDQNSTPSPSTEYKLSPSSPTSPPSSSSSSSFQSMKGSTSLPRESKIPVSSRQTPPPHSVSQSALSSVLEAESPPPKTQAPPARTRIPVSKVPVRRSGNKPGSTKGAANKK